MQNSERISFASKIGAILAAAGSAVGLGNVWRFPYETGNHGGAAFILIYLGCVFLFGLPIMIAEFTIGRRAKASTGEAFKVLAPKGGWKYVGYLGVLTGFLILGYYSVVSGWTLEYIFQSATGNLLGKSADDFVTQFQNFSQNPWRPLIWLLAFVGMTHFIIVKGVQRGIEQASKIMMPMLFIIIVLLAVCAVMLPGAMKGLEFLLKPDFCKITSDAVLGAMGQAFFSLSLGMGCLSTYASYFSRDTRLGHTAVSVCVIPMQDLRSFSSHSPMYSNKHSARCRYLPASVQCFSIFYWLWQHSPLPFPFMKCLPPSCMRSSALHGLVRHGL